MNDYFAFMYRMTNDPKFSDFKGYGYASDALVEEKDAFSNVKEMDGKNE